MDLKPLITPAVLAARMEVGERLVIVDTRAPAQYAEGHIPGAVNVNQIFTYLATSTAEGLAALRDEFAAYFRAGGVCGDERVVIYEDAMDNGYGQSCRGWFLLTYLGHPKVQILDGGLQGWKADDLPLSTEVPVVENGTFTPRLDDSLMITWQQMRDAVNDPGIIKLDTRARDEWEAESSSPYSKDFAPRKGRIPGAVWIDWLHMMERKGGMPRFRSREEILDLCRQAGIGPESRVYLYCFKGARASNTLVALREAGIRDVRLYFGSWNEWARNPELPIEEGAPAKRPIAPIDRAGLDALAEKGKASPGAVRTLKCKTVLEKRFRHLNYIRTLPAHVVDEPPQLLGDDTAPNPTEALLAALGSCISVGIHANAVARGIELYQVELELEGDINITSVWGVGDLGRDKVLGLSDIRIKVRLDGNVSREELASLVAHADFWSPVANTVRNPVSLRVSLAD